jgi:hypothetical protein
MRWINSVGLCIATFVLIAADVRRSHAAESSPEGPREIVLFPFDDYSLPLTKGLVLTLMPGRKSPTNPGLGIDAEHPGKPVLPIGKPGDPDYPRAYFYGTVLKIDGQYRMWYTGRDAEGRRQVCYAISADGLKWQKPKLGLVEYDGSTQNNLAAIDGNEPIAAMNALVLYEPDEASPDRRFKMIREVNPAAILAAVSRDGLRWTSVAGNRDVITGSNLEPSGLIKHNGVYYLNGHGGPVPHPIAARGYMRPQKRMMVTLVSYDFEQWSEAGHVSFRRDNVPPRPPLDFEFHRGEQVHLGAALWNRGNVLLGFYGQYHNATNDRRDSSVDLGLIVSHDALHFKEPIPDFKIVPSFEEDDRAEPRLTQGQAFENIGNRTVVYYGIWTETNRDGPTGVRVATWPRDRLGYFSPAAGVQAAQCVSCPLTAKRAQPGMYLNATGMSPENTLNVEILDEQFQPLPGYSAQDFMPLKDTSGLRLPLSWRGGKTLPKLDQPFRVRVNWQGNDTEKVKLYALYIE